MGVPGPGAQERQEPGAPGRELHRTGGAAHRRHRAGPGQLPLDGADPATISNWWARAFGVAAHTHAEHNYCWIDGPPGAPLDNISFVPVPEAKTLKNRVHWDVVGDFNALLDAGASLVRPRGDDLRWDVLADPEGNEFCVFPPGR